MDIYDYLLDEITDSELEKEAADYDIAGRYMAHGFADELEKIAAKSKVIAALTRQRGPFAKSLSKKEKLLKLLAAKKKQGLAMAKKYPGRTAAGIGLAGLGTGLAADELL